jgi:hypothetical protein
MVERLLVIVPGEERKLTSDLLVELAVTGWEQVIHLADGPARRGVGQTARLESHRILRLADDFGAGSVIITKEICCDQRVLESRQDLDIRRPSVGLLRRKVLKDELDLRGLHWRRVLQDRLALWEAKKSDVDHWLKQFDHFAARWVGETLLRQVDLIAPQELASAFDVAAHARLGANLVFTFLLDEDHASSSNRIGAILTRMYGPVEDFVSVLRNAPSGSRIVVCEDALWTGTEFRRLLERVATGGDLQAHAQGKRILFRYCVVSDYGLWVARHFLDNSGLADLVEPLLDERQRFIRVLDPNLDEQTIRSRWHLSSKEFDEWLSAHVRPLVFQEESLWQGRQRDAQRICENIGGQLVERYATERRKDWSNIVKSGFAIGAGRFGCALMFAHSIPKVCLPLFWLAGPITIDSRTIDWKPLFYDARRGAAMLES